MKPEKPWVRWTLRLLSVALLYVGYGEILSVAMFGFDCQSHPDHLASCRAAFWHPVLGMVYGLIGVLLALRNLIRWLVRTGIALVRRRAGESPGESVGEVAGKRSC
jgi:hypothetical protein